MGRLARRGRSLQGEYSHKNLYRRSDTMRYNFAQARKVHIVLQFVGVGEDARGRRRKTAEFHQVHVH